jgi:flagellar basal-body rod protein FlgC
MSHIDALTVNRIGLDYERARVEAASRNIALANIASTPGTALTVHQAALGPDFRVSIASVPAGARLAHEPGNPRADSLGMVSYPRIDLVAEMAALISASRAYEANVRAFNALRSLQLAALNIGGRQA